MKSLKYKMFLTLAMASAIAVKVSAVENTGANPFSSVLTATTSAELPAKAAELVVQADAKNLKQTTIDIVKAAVGLNPAAAPAIVGSIAQASPAAAGIAAATAVSLVPNQVLAITRAAAAAAPTKAGSIVESICRVLPKAYQDVANTVAQVVPGAGKEILAGIAAAIPELKGTISQTLAAFGGTIPSVSAVLAQVAQSQGSATTTALTSGSGPSLARGPSVGPPIVPPSTTPTTINPGTGGVIPSGGPRGYAAP
jgi:hypothetical protein